MKDGASKSDFTNSIIAIFALLVLAYFINLVANYFSKKTKSGMESNSNMDGVYNNSSSSSSSSSSPSSSSSSSVQPTYSDNSVAYASVPSSSSSSGAGGSPNKSNDPSELLPKNNNAWGGLIISKELKNKSFLEPAPSLIGIDTVLECNHRNANYQLRSDPPIQAGNVGPWNNSTISNCVNNVVPFELGRQGDSGAM